MSTGDGTKFVPLKYAILIVQDHQIKSRSQYWKWHRKNKIQYMPRYPNRVYYDWEGWNIFLGQANSFDKTKAQAKHYRGYWEAVRWAQKAAKQHNIQSKREWVQFHKDGNVPNDIPRYPDSEYSEFAGKGWPVWLGKDLTGKMMSEQQAPQLFAIMQYTTNSQPANMIVARLFKGGETEGREYLENNPDQKVMKAYLWDPDKAEMIKHAFETLASDQGDHNYLVNNLNDLLFELSTELKPWVS